MENPLINSSVNAIISAPEKWRRLLNQFEDALGVSIFCVDVNGRMLVAPGQAALAGNFGALFFDKTFGFDVQRGGDIALGTFEQGQIYLQKVDPFQLHIFAVPIIGEKDKIEFFLIVGPVVVNKPWPDDKYLALARQLGLADEGFLKEIRSVAQISMVVLGAILDLLTEVFKDALEVELEKEKFRFMQLASSSVQSSIVGDAQDIFLAIQQDQMLVSILDNAIRMANAQGGSIMLLEKESQEFVIRVSRGLENKKNILQTRIKIGQGIAGLAAKGKIPLFIKGTQSDEALRPLLKRPDIKHAIVIPLVAQEKVIGILNLYTKSVDDPFVFEHIADHVRQFSRFISTALQVI